MESRRVAPDLVNRPVLAANARVMEERRNGQSYCPVEPPRRPEGSGLQRLVIDEDFMRGLARLNLAMEEMSPEPGDICTEAVTQQARASEQEVEETGAVTLNARAPAEIPDIGGTVTQIARVPDEEPLEAGPSGEGTVMQVARVPDGAPEEIDSEEEWMQGVLTLTARVPSPIDLESTDSEGENNDLAFYYEPIISGIQSRAGDDPLSESGQTVISVLQACGRAWNLGDDFTMPAEEKNVFSRRRTDDLQELEEGTGGSRRDMRAKVFAAKIAPYPTRVRGFFASKAPRAFKISVALVIVRGRLFEGWKKMVGSERISPSVQQRTRALVSLWANLGNNKDQDSSRVNFLLAAPTFSEVVGPSCTVCLSMYLVKKDVTDANNDFIAQSNKYYSWG